MAEFRARMLSAQEAAVFLHVHVETIRRLARSGELPRMKVGRQWRFSRETLDRWAESHRERSTIAKRVLIVDDELSLRRSQRPLLAAEGYDVSTAADGVEALDLMTQRVPDVVLLDLVMPNMNGATVLGEIRKRYGDLPVIIYTGYPDSELMVQALEHGPILMLAKPVVKADLLKAIRTALATR